VIPFPSSSGRRVDVKNRNRIGDSVDPCGIPVVCGRMQSVYSLILRHVVLSLRKDWMKRVIQGRKAFALRLWISLSCETLSNASEMSRHNIEATVFRFVLQTVLTCSVMSSSAEVVNRPGRAPICDSGRRPFSSAALFIRFAIRASSVFARVLRRAIGRYAPSFV
jgi:hypothetical protein